jgi:hypothetical protein
MGAPCLKSDRPGAAKGLIAGIQILPVVDAEAGEHMRPCHHLFDAHVGERSVAREFPVVGEMEARIFDRSDHARTLYAEICVAESEPRHILEGDPIHARLAKRVHVLAISLAVGDDVQPEIALVLGRPAHHLVRFGQSERRLPPPRSFAGTIAATSPPARPVLPERVQRLITPIGARTPRRNTSTRVDDFTA